MRADWRIIRRFRLHTGPDSSHAGQARGELRIPDPVAGLMPGANAPGSYGFGRDCPNPLP